MVYRNNKNLYLNEWIWSIFLWRTNIFIVLVYIQQEKHFRSQFSIRVFLHFQSHNTKEKIILHFLYFFLDEINFKSIVVLCFMIKMKIEWTSEHLLLKMLIPLNMRILDFYFYCFLRSFVCLSFIQDEMIGVCGFFFGFSFRYLIFSLSVFVFFLIVLGKDAIQDTCRYF